MFMDLFMLNMDNMNPKIQFPISKNRFIASAILWVACAVLSPSVAFSDTVLVLPPGLNPGDQYRIAFVTYSEAQDATSSDIAVYDAFVTAEANAAGSLLLPLNTTWQVIGSTLNTDAYTHIGGNFTVPVYGIDGILIANNAADMWDGSLDSPIMMTQFGVGRSGYAINSGTTATGGASVAPLGGGIDGWYDAKTLGLAGTIFAWISGGGLEGKSGKRPFYGISGILTVGGGSVSVPEPASSLSLVILGLASLCVFRRSKRC
jgi:hypothetical protein